MPPVCMTPPAPRYPIQWSLLILVFVALVGSTKSRAAHPSPTECPCAETKPLPATFTGLRLALWFPPSRSSKQSLQTAQPSKDQWLARDKARHVVFSGLWTLSTQYVLVSKANWREPAALPASVASGAAVGLAKELYDASQPTGTISGKDLVADAVGIGLAVGLVAL